MPESQNLSAFRDYIKPLIIFFANKYKCLFLFFRFYSKLQNIKALSGQIRNTYEHILNIDLLDLYKVIKLFFNIPKNLTKKLFQNSLADIFSSQIVYRTYFLKVFSVEKVLLYYRKFVLNI